MNWFWKKRKLTTEQMLKDIQDFGLQIAEDTDDLEKMSNLPFDKLTFKELYNVETAVRKFHTKYIRR
jgi:hypothetical protein